MIVLEHLCKTYPGEEPVEALKDVNFSVRDGEFVAIVGASGSGKSTLMNILGCLDRPTKGRYLLDGEEVSALPEAELTKIRNQKIGFIFQSFNLIQTLTALENVELPLLYRGYPRTERQKLAREALDAMGLSNRRTHLPSRMSGGQQQRVAIARAIAARPPLILADEPTGNLDSASGSDVFLALRGLHSEGKTIVLITHDSALAERCERKVQVFDGKVEQNAEAVSIRTYREFPV